MGPGAFGRYELRGVLGRGAFATVYRARDPALAREVALKALMRDLADDADIQARFLAEAQAIAQLDHPNIVGIYDVGEADGRPFFAMPLIAGPTLAELIAAEGAQPLARTLAIVRQLASAVDYLHAAGLVHRDIKAANIMLDGSGRAVLMDFGIARALEWRRGATAASPPYSSSVLEQNSCGVFGREAMARDGVR